MPVWVSETKIMCTQLLEVMEDFTQLIDNGYPVDVVYLDFKKAFDAVPHHRLMGKLASYGIKVMCTTVLRTFCPIEANG